MEAAMPLVHTRIASADPAASSRTAREAPSDAALMARMAGGDRLAMRTLFARHQLRVYRFVVRIVGDKAQAEDVVSEVFFDAWRQARRFESRSAVSTWLLAIARNKALSALKRRPHETFDAHMVASVADPNDDPEAAVHKRTRGECLRRCLTRLSAEHGLIIDLVYYHEKSIREVAQIVGIPENTVKTRMFYARKRLAELLTAAGIDRAAA
jgi:RNA polymerase sigma-70 factor (ECF subfamily)